MAIVNNLVMQIDGQNVVVYPNTVGRAVYINESNGYNLIQALADLRNNVVSEWGDVRNKPFVSIGQDFKVDDGVLKLNGSFSMEWNSIQNKPSAFNSSWGRVSGKPTLFPSNWSMIENKPSIYNTNWNSVENKPYIYNTNWNSVEEKPNYFPADWFTLDNKPFNLLDNEYFYVNTYEQQNILSIIPGIFTELYDAGKQKNISNNEIPYLYYNIPTSSLNGGVESNIVQHLKGISYVGFTSDAENDIVYYVANALGKKENSLFVDANNQPEINLSRMREYYILHKDSSYFFHNLKYAADQYRLVVISVEVAMRVEISPALERRPINAVYA